MPFYDFRREILKDMEEMAYVMGQGDPHNLLKLIGSNKRQGC